MRDSYRDEVCESAKIGTTRSRPVIQLNTRPLLFTSRDMADLKGDSNSSNSNNYSSNSYSNNSNNSNSNNSNSNSKSNRDSNNNQDSYPFLPALSDELMEQHLALSIVLNVREIDH
ncbi:hypothetical protein HZH66_008069 [Vespula vulgaris]|uniref:Uncharacterized protein n=1 Tax=Vespula vulgaris TaxID=7454 RepID=A0A834N3Y1_VESVU|nr:hypothetical protein HZH66_008069 [Vespula vulgaris]